MPHKVILEDMEAITSCELPWQSILGKNVLVTGASGLLPSYMIEALLYINNKNGGRRGKVLALVRNIDKAKKRFREHLDRSDLEFISQDVCDPINVKNKIDYIIHAASPASPRYYGVDPVGTLMANTIGTWRVLECAREHGAEKVLYFSSSEVYGNVRCQKISEKDYAGIDILHVRACYSESKRMGETMCASWLYQHKVPVVIARPFHTYGPGMAMDDGRVFADFVYDIVMNKDIFMKSDGSAIRSYCYLADAVAAFYYILFGGIPGHAYNVGNPTASISVYDLAKKLVSMYANKNIVLKCGERISNNYIKSDISCIVPDVTKIQELGWTPTTGIEAGFRRTIEYHTDCL
jgi:UDP-glucuronate decarboxylase